MCAGPGYLACWDKYWAWSQTEQFRERMRPVVAAPDFLAGNYLSTDLRVPVTLLETNACSPLATNGIRGNIWDNFTSESYKTLPPVGTVVVHHPVTGEPKTYVMPGGGRGYTRVPSLISAWSTAPFLLNNTLGHFEVEPSVAGRMASFEDAMGQLLWPERREKDSLLGARIPGLIDRTTTQSYLRVPGGYLPASLQGMLGFWSRLAPGLFGSGGIEIGPFPKGMPVNLLSNLNLLSESTDPAERARHDAKVLALLIRVKHALADLPKTATDEEARAALGGLVDPLLELSKCQDFEVNRGHYFGTSLLRSEPGLSDQEKHALIAFVKTF